MKKRRHIVAMLLIAFALSPTDSPAQEKGATILLPSRKPTTPDEVKKETAKGAESIGGVGLPFIANDTYLTDPSSLLGSVLVLRKSDAGNTVERPVFEFSGFQDITPGPTEYKFERGVSSMIVDQALAMNVSFLSFFSGQLTASNLLSMTVKNELIQRVKDDAKWKAAYNAWRGDTNNAPLFTDTNVTKILVVRGYVLKSFTYKNYVRVQGEAKGSYGVSVDGKGYYSKDENKVDYLWGIDYAVIFARATEDIKPSLVHAPVDPTPGQRGAVDQVLSGLRIMRKEK